MTSITRQDSTYELSRRGMYSIRIEHLMAGDVTLTRGEVVEIAPTGNTVTVPGRDTVAVYSVSFAGTGKGYSMIGGHVPHVVEMTADETIFVTTVAA